MSARRVPWIPLVVRCWTADVLIITVTPTLVPHSISASSKGVFGEISSVMGRSSGLSASALTLGSWRKAASSAQAQERRYRQDVVVIIESPKKMPERGHRPQSTRVMHRPPCRQLAAELPSSSYHPSAFAHSFNEFVSDGLVLRRNSRQMLAIRRV